jgi:hypothetical protein
MRKMIGSGKFQTKFFFVCFKRHHMKESNPIFSEELGLGDSIHKVNFSTHN